jgi:hypothetical protein
MRLDAHLGVGNLATKPKPGDVCVCAYCATINVMTGDGLRTATRLEAWEYLTDPKVRAAVSAAVRWKPSS